MTDYVCVPWKKGQPGFGGGEGSNCVMVDARVVYREQYAARTLLRGPGGDEVETYSHESIAGIGVNSFTTSINSKEEFAKYATNFEKAYSILTAPPDHWYEVSAYPNYHKAAPVIDKDYLIVGHYGWFPGNRITLPASARRSAGKGELYIEFGLQDLINAGVPVFVGKRETQDTVKWSTDEQLYALLTDPDGRVLLYTNYDILGLQSADDVLLVLSLVAAAGSLVYAGAKLGVRALARKFGKDASKALKRPKLPAKVLFGDPPQVNVGSFARPGNLTGHVEVSGGKVVYKVKTIILRGQGSAKEMAEIEMARLAHREMIMRAAEQAQKAGLKEFKFLGVDANANFQAHANRLAAEVGVPNSGTVLAGSAPGFSSYEVTLDVAKVLAQQ
jgi:hypothetical protein